jgi:type I site-specific restriction endonuclease
MPRTPEEKARQTIDTLLQQAGWTVQNRADANIDAARGVAIREFSLGHGFGEADYLLFVDGRAAGVIEAKKEGTALVGVEIQTQKYSEGIPEALPAPYRPLPFCYQSTGIETRFTNLLEPDASSRGVFSFHTPAPGLRSQFNGVPGNEQATVTFPCASAAIFRMCCWRLCCATAGPTKRARSKLIRMNVA